jgi:hypothetical protein
MNSWMHEFSRQKFVDPYCSAAAACSGSIIINVTEPATFRRLFCQCHLKPAGIVFGSVFCDIASGNCCCVLVFVMIGCNGGGFGIGGVLFDDLLHTLIGGVVPCEILLRSDNMRCISSWSPLSANEFSCLS